MYFTLNHNLINQSGVLTPSKEGKIEKAPEGRPDPELETSWVLWEQVVPQQTRTYNNENYSDNTKQVASFDKLTKFWEVWEHIPQPSELLANKKMISVGATATDTQIVDAIMIFRKDIKPMWEDPANARGGHFEFKFKSHSSEYPAAQIDEYWNNLTLAVIGDMIEPQGSITGVRLVDKLSSKGSGFLRIEVWFKDISKPQEEMLRNTLLYSMSTKLDGSLGPLLNPDTKPHHGR